MFFLKNICFLCLCDDQKNLIDIFHLDDNKTSYQTKIEYCMAELVNDHFEIPKLICFTCQQYLNFVYIFKQKCIENNIRLKRYINQLKSDKPLYDDKYQNLHISLADYKLKSIKLEVANHLDDNEDFNFDKCSINCIPESYLHDESIIIKEEFIDLNENSFTFNEVLTSEEIDNIFTDTVNESRLNLRDNNQQTKLILANEILIAEDNITSIESQNAAEDVECIESSFSEACQNLFTQESDKSHRNNNKQTTVILTNNYQNVIFEIDSSVLQHESKDSSINNILAENNEQNDDKNTEDFVDKNDSEQKIISFDVYKIKKDKLSGKYHCTFCEKSYGKSTKLDIHLRKFHIEDKPFHCKICPAKFQFRSKLNNHLKISHDNIFACKICNKKFQRKYKLTAHLKLHTEKEYQCEICFKKFRRKYHYTNHLTIHTGEKAFDCPDCDKKFSTKFNLTAHLRVHTGVKPYVCSICGKGFKDWKHRRAHMDSHVGYKRYACSVCSRRFTTESSLNGHMVTHTNNRPFVCPVCSKRFRDKWHLAAHTKIHSKSRVVRVMEKVKCDFCEKLFGKGAGIKKHIKTHDKE